MLMLLLFISVIKTDVVCELGVANLKTKTLSLQHFSVHKYKAKGILNQSIPLWEPR